MVITDAEDRYDLPELSVLVPEDARPGSLSEKAYYLIRDLIVTLQLEPGSPIDERRLMRELDLGRTPVREGLRRLADEHLVEVYPRRGTLVAPVDIGDLGAVSEVRLELEGFAARLAAERATAEEREAARALVDEVEREVHGSGDRRLMYLDQRIHRHVHGATHNDHLRATLQGFYVHALRMWFVVLDRVSRLEDAVHEHRDLLRSVIAGDPDRAEEVARRHVRGFEQEIRRVL